MNPQAFEAELRKDGFLDIETKYLEPRPANGDHGHHFSVRGLVLEGQFIVTQNDIQRTYGPGDVFAVTAGEMHCEAVGPEGAKITVGRKY